MNGHKKVEALAQRRDHSELADYQSAHKHVAPPGRMVRLVNCKKGFALKTLTFKIHRIGQSTPRLGDDVQFACPGVRNVPQAHRIVMHLTLNRAATRIPSALHV